MSIPLDRLYHFVESIAKEIADNILIYHFFPHGSKKLDNLQELVGPVSWQDKALNISLYCNDQEPLNYDLYQNIIPTCDLEKIQQLLSIPDCKKNFRIFTSIYNNDCLLHSEQRSKNLLKYQNDQVITVYYWAHALISLDWFRFAKHVTQKKHKEKIFLIYNRAWSGTREYRLKFAELLINSGLQDHCRISINPVEPELGIHYKLHTFKNSVWEPTTVLENFLLTNTAHSHYSADFDINDYENTDIEVVLETLFDDDRLHLTEKSLRPIACGQPFILAGTHGSLEYLRGYGFKTFGDLWDESYDLVEDPQERLIHIANLMQSISNWDPMTCEKKMAQAQVIAEYNKNHFFSDPFTNQILTELKNNLHSAISHVYKINDFTKFITHWEYQLSFKEIRDVLETEKPGQHPGITTLTQVNNVLKIAKDLYQQQITNQQNKT